MDTHLLSTSFFAQLSASLASISLFLSERFRTQLQQCSRQHTKTIKSCTKSGGLLPPQVFFSMPLLPQGNILNHLKQQAAVAIFPKQPSTVGTRFPLIFTNFPVLSSHYFCAAEHSTPSISASVLLATALAPSAGSGATRSAGQLLPRGLSSTV